jgi:DNA-binding MarR family transcriptional regulator
MPVSLISGRAARGERGYEVAEALTGATASMACYATALRKASRRLTALYDEALAPSGLRTTQYVILGELLGGAPVTINELARRLVLDRSGLGHSLRPLQRDGLISLDQGTADRRSVNITLTEEGRRRYEAARPRWLAAQDQVLAVLGRPTADQLREQLNAIAQDDRLTPPRGAGAASG